eukprot:295168-Chlamydomonas_euryale.AAC.2
MELASSRAVVAEKAAEVARAEAEARTAMQGWQREAALRMEAEASEKRALTAAAQQAGVGM